ncbi:hypothetical protein V3C33_01985 [Micrococcaceae bacterium Sec5.7]
MRRAPDIREAAVEAYGDIGESSVVSLHELVGAIGAHEWRRNGVYVDALQGRIHPYYGTFFPTRSEYVDLVATAALPSDTLAFDVGTGTGVLAASRAVASTTWSRWTMNRVQSPAPVRISGASMSKTYANGLRKRFRDLPHQR